MTDEQSIERAIQEVVKEFGRIDYAVNNAGIAGANTPSAVTSTVEWQRLLNVNLNGVWMSSRAEIQQMLQQEPLKPECAKTPFLPLMPCANHSTPANQDTDHPDKAEGSSLT